MTVVLIRLLFALALTLVVSGASAQQPRKPAAPTPAESAAIERRLTDAARRNPDSFDAQYQLASFYVQKGRLDEALPHLRRACALDPANYDSGHDLALALLVCAIFLAIGFILLRVIAWAVARE